MGKLDHVLDGRQVESLKRWCIMKQSGGFQGRPNKDADTCYSFWVGATLKLLSSHHLVNPKEDVDFVKSTEDCGQGGLAKFPNNFPGKRILSVNLFRARTGDTDRCVRLLQMFSTRSWD